MKFNQRFILVVAVLSLLVCQTVMANPVIIKGVGQVDIPQNIVVKEKANENGSADYLFDVKDGEVQRRAVLMPVSNVRPDLLKDIKKADVLLDQQVKKSFNQKDVVCGKAKVVMIGKRECAAVVLKMPRPNTATADMSLFIVSAKDGFKIFGFVCDDKDLSYWQPTIKKIIGSFPQ